MIANTRSLRFKLLIGASLSSLMLAGVAEAQNGRITSGRGGGNPVDGAVRAAQDQAARQAEASSASRRAVEAFARVAASRKAMTDAQAAARAAALAAQRNIPNGLGAGGLQVANGVSLDPNLWIGADGPTQSQGTDGRTDVTIDQTQQQAILTWDSFNVGQETDLIFNQGGSNWVALNRVTDASADPTKILGSIKADGSVYIINRNGIIFGGASQVNVRNLVASTANITNDAFLTSGIYSATTGSGTRLAYVPSFTDAGGAVTVEAGAQITTNTPESVTVGGGFVLLMGTEVTNAGTIVTARGQTALSAGDDFILRRGYGTDENQGSTTRGNEVRGLLDADSLSGTVTNSGLIEAAQGDITLAGRTIRQDGVVVATTSVNQRGTIHLLNSATDIEGSVTLGKDSLTLILPDLDSKDTALNSQRDALIKESEEAALLRDTRGGFDDRSLLADRLDQSRVEIVTGGDVLFEGGSQTMAQGGQVAVQAAGRITVADGASIDVSGVQGVALDMASNAIKVNIQGNELRDSPDNRESDSLKNNDVWVDVRDLILLPDGAGGYEGDRWYTSGGLLEVGGYVANTAHSIGEWAAVGGTITLAGNEVIAERGARFDISGGTIDYRAGLIQSTRLMGEDGRLYDISDAPVGMKMVAVGNAFMVKHERWGEAYTEVYSDPLFSRADYSRWEDGYTVGRDAGRLILSAPTVIMEADILAEVTNGARQIIGRPDVVTDGYALSQHTVARAGTLALGVYEARGLDDLFETDVRISDVEDVTGGEAFGEELPADRINTAWFDADHLNAQGLGKIELGTRDSITIDAPLELANGGALDLTAPVIDIAANVTARGGSVTATNWFEPAVAGAGPLLRDGAASVTLRDGATLDLRGQWLNLAKSGDDAAQLGFLNGGRVLLESTHDVVLEEGSLIDVSSGGAVLVDGSTRGGRGGDVALIADRDTPTGNVTGLLTLDGDIRAYGVTGGGTLQLESGSAVVIGGEVLASRDVLEAGDSAPINLMLGEDLSIAAGETLPLDYTYAATVAPAGVALPSGVKAVISTTETLTVMADWTLPPGVEVRKGSTRYRNGATVPAGTVLTFWLASGSFPEGYVLPSDVFPDGVPIAPTNLSFAAGSAAPIDIVLTAGTVIPTGVTLARDVAIKPVLHLAADQFQSGFSNYQVNGHLGVHVASDATIDVNMPVYRFMTDSIGMPSGAAPGSALEVWTPPTYMEDVENARLQQRGGASLELRSTTYSGSANTGYVGGPVTVDTGVVISVDPGESIALTAAARSQITIDGTLNAWGGAISIDMTGLGKNGNGAAAANSIWIGDNAVLDVAGRAVIAKDQFGRRYGVVDDGGVISIGGALDWEETGVANAINAFVVVRPGAKLDASGAGATFDLPVDGLTPASTSVDVAGNGGSIILKSNNGLFIDGDLKAAAGGAGAAGGTLALALEAPNYGTSQTIDDRVLSPREFVLTQDRRDSGLDATAEPGTDAITSLYGAGAFSAEAIDRGGFDNLSLLVNGVLSFDGDVDLNLNQSLRFYVNAYGLADSSPENTAVQLSAAYVQMAEATTFNEDNAIMPAALQGNWGPSQRAPAGTFSVSADLIDVRDQFGFGISGTIPFQSGAGQEVDRRGFDQVELSSRGDLRFLANSSGTPNSYTVLETSGDLILSALRIYPATHASALVSAGRIASGVDLDRVLDIRRPDAGTSSTPMSVFGQLRLDAPTIRQGGSIYAPMGQVILGEAGGSGLDVETTRIDFLPGSLTSVSVAGLVMPYGGSLDGLSYQYEGQDIELLGAGGNDQWRISVNAQSVNVEDGAVLDLSGGGDLVGAAFISGRGGSVDILHAALADASPGYEYSASGNAVYAIVPDYKAGYAPISPDAGAGDPAIGRQITIPEGVPGLPAGVYTLMPSTYALLPGAFRVEIGADNQTGLSGVTPTGRGSYIAAGYMGIANTGIRDTLASQVLITPGKTVRAHSTYNEMGYNDFVLADAARFGKPRAAITSDAAELELNFDTSVRDDAEPALTFHGKALFDPEADTQGFGGMLSVLVMNGTGDNTIEVLGEGSAATEGFGGVSLYDVDLNRITASRTILGGDVLVNYRFSPNVASIGEAFNTADSVTIRSGTALTGAELMLVTSSPTGGVVIEEGASISTLGGGAAAWDSSDGYAFRPNRSGALVISNGWINLLAPVIDATGVRGSGPINIGACVTTSCDGVTEIYSEGTIAFATDKAFTLADNVEYGTRNLVLGVSAVNLGEADSLDAAQAAGQLPAGMMLNQSRLAELLAGNVASGAPALESLILNARDSVNIFGSVTLDTLDPTTGVSSLERLVLGTPAIYGYGAVGDIATISTGELIWTGLVETPGAAIGAALGDGVLNIDAERILFGYGPNTQPNTTATDNRLAVGFATVNLTASESVTSSGKSTLGVYHRQGDYIAGEGYQYTGGGLNISTPLLTGEAGSINRIAAGGAVTVSAPEGAVADATSDALGAQIELAGQSISVDTAVVLPSGKLTLAAIDDVTLQDGARLDLSGREIELFDVKKYSWGGDLILTSEGGDILADAGSTINLSAVNNRGGTLTAVALGEAAGRVDLAGTILGKATGQYDAGGTIVPYDGAEFNVRAQALADFAGLNERLNAGEVFGARRFQIKQGDLTVGDGVKARDVEIVLDGGDLTIDGTIDASSFQVGSIRLAAMGDLTVNGTLDAHGTGLRVDSYGKIIDSPNRAIVDLTTRKGTLTLAGGATIDLRAGTEVAQGTWPGQNDGRARGTLDLNAPRLGGAGGQGGIDGAGNGANDVAVNVLGSLNIQGAKTIAVNAFRVYDDAPLADLPDVSGETPQLITQAYLDGIENPDGNIVGGIDPHNAAFINAALANTDLSNRLAGLGDYHLRPGVELISNVQTNPNGDLTISGDIDLSAYRYGPGSDRGDPDLRGYGEPGVLVFRAAGDLNVYGSINDGFVPPPGTPDDEHGWLLTEARDGNSINQREYGAFGGDIIVPIDGVVLEAGTLYPVGSTLNYDVPVDTLTLPIGATLPVDATLSADFTLPSGSVIGADIYDADGGIAFAAGTVLSSDVTLTAGMRLGAGITLRNEASFVALTWPAGVKLPVAMVLSAAVTLPRGGLIPSMTNVELANDEPIDLRPTVDGRQGRNWAIAPMLGEGATSWDLQLTAGADLESADVRAVGMNARGSLTLGDTHYVIKTQAKILGGAAFVGAEGNMWGFIPGDPISTDNLFFCGFDLTACTVVGGDFVWAEGNYLGFTPGEVVAVADQFNCANDPTQCVATGGVEITQHLPTSPGLSVVRTGTGDLGIRVAGDVAMRSLYGVYTAGAHTGFAAAGAQFDRPRGLLRDGTAAGPGSDAYAEALDSYQAWYPDQGGNVSIVAGGDITGDIMSSVMYARSRPSNSVGNWLWRQGTGSADVDQNVPTAWWINFGAYSTFGSTPGFDQPAVSGFAGIGTLGGGNVTLIVGGDAGSIDALGDERHELSGRSQGLNIAVGSTGRVLDGVMTLTGGGDIEMRIGGELNPLETTFNRLDLNGSIVNLRGQTSLAATSIGHVRQYYAASRGSTTDKSDVRPANLFEPSFALSTGGPTLVLGDSAAFLDATRDVVLGGAGDPGRISVSNLTPFAVDGQAYEIGESWFSLWTDHSAINLFAAGGALTPGSQMTEAVVGGQFEDGRSNFAPTDGRFLYPSIFRAVAPSANIYAGPGAASGAGITDIGQRLPYSMLLAPSPTGVLEILSGGSIMAQGLSINMSGSDTELPTPFNPAFSAIFGVNVLASNLSAEGLENVGDLFAFGPNTALNRGLHVGNGTPIRFYAVGGDIIGLRTGEMLEFTGTGANGRTNTTWYEAAAPLWMKAGRDIVNVGTPPGVPVRTPSPDMPSGDSTGNLIVHNNTDDVSIISAGRDIIYANFLIAGPGNLEISAGRNILQEANGSVTSLGPIIQGDDRPGASIAMMAGMGSSGPDFSAIRDRYLDPANLAEPERPLSEQPGKAVKTYETELAEWLDDRFGVTGTTEENLAYFDALAPEQQTIFLRDVYYAELREGGREYNDPDSSRFASYLRGREMIATLFPDKDADGNEIVRPGDITLFGGSGVRTNFGGNIQMMAPGGQIVVGVNGEVPPTSSGLITQGVGNIQLFSEKSLLLGLSRIMTTFGGDIFAWSEEGDINAGRGAKSTILFTPPKRTLDNYGNVTLAPQVPSSGAGIATLDPIPEVAPGDIDLIAPLGTIDAGEAGIRVSGNVNLAALQVINAANIQVKGDAKGVPMAAVVNTGALTAASAATSSVVAEASRLAERARPQRQEIPTIVTVRLLGFGDQP